MQIRIPLVAILLLILSGPLGTRGTSLASDPAGYTQRIHFSALNKKERPVLNLAEKDFELHVNDSARPMEGFRPGLPQTDHSVPLVAWILIDFNPNINAAIVKRQASAVADVFRLFHPESLIGVKLVSDRSETLAPLGHDPAGLRAAFSGFGEHRFKVSAGASESTVMVGEGGIARAIELAIVETAKAIGSSPTLASREVHRAVMVLSDGNINPAYKTRTLFENAARDEVFFYPVYLPRGMVGPWIEYYADLGRKSGGVAAALGAITPGLDPSAWSGTSDGPNALTFNFLQMARDLNGKYSFVLTQNPGAEMKLSVRCRVSGVTIRLPRRSLP